MSGFRNEVMVADNVDFSGTGGGAQILLDGQLLMGATATPNIRTGTLTSTGMTIDITYVPGATPSLNLETHGGQAATSFDVDAHTGPGTDPVVPDGSGIVTITGGQTAPGTIANIIQTNSLAANTYTIQIQQTSTAAAKDVTLNGVAHFNSADFLNDQGFISLGASKYPISPYVVGPVGFAGYQTIQSALDAANAAGSGAVWVMPGTYTENLTLYPTSQIVGAVSNSDVAGNASIITIAGIHTPPTTGSISISNVYLSSATDIFNSAAAGSATLILENVNINCTNGYTFNLLNWTGALAKFNVQDDSTTNGVVNNTGGAVVYIQSSNSGAGTAKTMTVSGPTVLKRSDLVCPMNCVTGATVQSDFGIHEATVTMSNNSAGSFNNVRFSTGATPALTQSSSGVILLLHSIIDSSNVPAITGAGAGVITYSDLVFVNNATFAGTLTLNTTSWQPYAKAIASTDGTKVGTCAFDSSQFSVDANGFVSITSGGDIHTINGDSGSITGATVTIYANNAAQNAGSTVKFVNSGTTSTFNVSDLANANTIIGAGSGNATLTSQITTILGTSSGQSLTSGNGNCIIGSDAGTSISTGYQNTVIGNHANSSAGGAFTGNNNTIIGYRAGENYAVAEANNILLGNAGTVGDSNVIRIGDDGSINSPQTKCFIQGIASVSVANKQMVTINTSTGQMGSQAIPSTISWSDASGALSAVAFNGYFITATSTATLPASPSQGDTISFIVDTAQILTIQASGSQKIRVGAAISIAGGICVNKVQGDAITLVYRAANTTWIAESGTQGIWATT